MNASEILETRLVPHLIPIIGSTLVDVGYRVLKYEATAQDIDRPGFYLGGEVRLRFDRTSDVYVSWDQIAGWADDTTFSLLLSQQTAFSEDGLDELSASNTKIWLPHIGKVVQCVTVLGIGGVPFVLVIETGRGAIFVGSSYRTEFGDGDDVFVSNDANSIQSMSPIWQRRENE